MAFSKTPRWKNTLPRSEYARPLPSLSPRCSMKSKWRWWYSIVFENHRENHNQCKGSDKHALPQRCRPLIWQYLDEAGNIVWKFRNPRGICRQCQEGRTHFPLLLSLPPLWQYVNEAGDTLPLFWTRRESYKQCQYCHTQLLLELCFPFLWQFLDVPHGTQ